MYPDTPYDKEGVRSGNVFINDDGVPTVIYTGSDGATRNPAWSSYGMLATSTDGMLTWQKHPTPVIPEPALSGNRYPPRRPDLEGRRHLVPAHRRELPEQRCRAAPQLQRPVRVGVRRPHLHRRGREAGRRLGAALPTALWPQGRDDDRDPSHALLRRNLR